MEQTGAILMRSSQLSLTMSDISGLMGFIGSIEYSPSATVGTRSV